MKPMNTKGLKMVVFVIRLADKDKDDARVHAWLNGKESRVIEHTETCRAGEGSVMLFVWHRDIAEVGPPASGDDLSTFLTGDDLSIKAARRRLEKVLIIRALEKVGGNRTEAAQLLKICLSTLIRRMKELKINIT